MIKKLAQYLEARSLLRSQRRAAEELQAICDARVAMALREQYLMRLSASLAVRELDQNVTARREHRAAAW